jgi:hypothetical protein
MACDNDYLGAINTTKYIYVYEDSAYGTKATPTLLGEANSYSAYPLNLDGATLEHEDLLGAISSDSDEVYYGDSEWDCAEYLDIPEECDTYDGTDMEMANVYKIVGYSDDMLSVDGNCEDCSESAEDAWNGTFTYGVGCDENDPSFGSWFGSANDAASINGKLHYYSSGVYYYGSEPYYLLYIACYDSVQELDIEIWVGYKYIGADHAGVYERNSGCDSTETLTLERA